MGAVRPKLPKLPKVKLTDPCVPASKHFWQLVQRNRIPSSVQYYLLFRCLHCANSVYVITKAFTIKKPRLPSSKGKRQLT